MISENIINFKTTELVEKIKNGEVSSKALCEVYINRIEKFEKKFVPGLSLIKKNFWKRLKKQTRIDLQANLWDHSTVYRLH